MQEHNECFFFVADWHALSTNYEDTSQLQTFIHELLIDWLAVGIDPERATVFIQSHVPEHAILNLLLSMITPVPLFHYDRQAARVVEILHQVLARWLDVREKGCLA